MLVVLVWPTVLLTAALLDNLQLLSETLDAGPFEVPPPPESVAGWPVIGPSLYQLWDLASTNMDAALTELKPQIEAIASWLLTVAAGTGLGVLQFVLSIIISGILIAHSAAGHGFAQKFAIRLSGERGSTFVDLAEATVRGVARGVIGVAFIQMLLVGLGLSIAGVPWAGLWTFLALLLAIMQIGVAPVMIGAIIYMFTTADTLTAAAEITNGSDLVFPSPRGKPGKPMTGKCLSDMCARLGIDAVPHGFRSSFRDWASEKTNTPHAVMEAALAHVNPNQVEAAYARSDLFERRRKLMNQWAGYLAGSQGKVIRLHG